jgi:hypothetical protein
MFSKSIFFKSSRLICAEKSTESWQRPDRFQNIKHMRILHPARSLLTAFVVFCVPLLNGCSSYAPTDRILDNSRDQVIQALGQPSTELAIDDGRVMIFPRGPFGKHTYFVYLDQNGRVTHWTQVLDDKNFARIKTGMHRNEVIAIIGDGKDTFGLALDRGYVWNYRFVNPFCFWFQVEFTRDHIVRSTGYSKPPECRIRG